MHNTHVSGKSVCARESLLFLAQGAADLCLADVVNCVLVTRKVIRPRENCIARLSSGRVDALTLVRSGLRVALHELLRRHAGSYTGRDIRGPAVRIALVLLQFLRRREALSASVVGTAVGTSACGAVGRLWR
jgi:hypothetical protein